VRVALDAQLAVGTATGIGTYQRDLARALAAAGIDVRTLQFPALDPWRFDRRVVWDQLLLPWLAARSGAGVLHAASGTLPLVRTLPVVVTVHDMAWLRVQAHTRAYARAYFGGLMKRLYRGAAAIMTDSAFARDEFLELAGPRENVQVVYPGVDERFAALARRPRARPFALVAGTVERRKNLLRAVETLAAVPELDLVAVGPPTPYLDEVRARVAALGLGERVAVRGYVARAELDALYAEAALALAPSRYEGFGYAVAEALCAGLPVIAARSSSLVEVAGGDAPLIDPDDAAGWVDAVRALLADRDAAERRAAAARAAAVERFAWSRAAAECKAIYQSIA
jgi:glycosyltransferase involved in cell wall biosynthesis